MEAQFFEKSINLRNCTDLTEAAETTWAWLCENLNELTEDDHRQIHDRITDEFARFHPDRCPQLESEYESAIATGIRRAQAKIEQQLAEFENYAPPQ